MSQINRTIIEIYENTITPFEKLDEKFKIKEKASDEVLNSYKEYWINSISSQKNNDAILAYFNHYSLNEEQIGKMLSPVELVEKSDLPSWAEFLDKVMNQTKSCLQIPNNLAEIPYAHLLQPFVRYFVLQNSKWLDKNKRLKQNLEGQLYRKLSGIAQGVLQKEFDCFKSNYTLNRNSNGSTIIYGNFVSDNLKNSLEIIFLKYPLMAKFLAMNTLNFGCFVSKIFAQFIEDKIEISNYFNSATQKEDDIIEINLSIGDYHHGECAAIIKFENGCKLVYKPGSQKISAAYNGLLIWVNEQIDSKLQGFRVLDKTNYGWLEFVQPVECKEEREVEEYYKNAGVILGLTYFLHSNDYHYENVIASGVRPVLVDHETLIQPTLKRYLDKRSTEEKNRLEGTVLKPSLLPIHSNKTGIENSAMCGFGSSKVQYIKGWTKKIVNENTDASYRAVQMTSIKCSTFNKPYLNGEEKHLTDYSIFFLKGFNASYQLFMNKKKYLLSKKSPLIEFDKCQVRYVWRPTKIYDKIKKIILEPEYLCDAVKFGLKIEALSRAYLQKEFTTLLPLLDEEREQLLEGDIPIFKIKTDTNNMTLKESILSIFEKSCLATCKDKIRAASYEDLSFQENLILKSMQL